MELIDKSAVVAEIDALQEATMDKNRNFLSSYDEGKFDALTVLEYFLNTLEVKEVDDEKCKEYDKALSIAKAWYKSSDSSAQERNVARMIMGDKVREEL